MSTILVIPEPINIQITNNTFIRYRISDGITVEVGLITGISDCHTNVTIRRFLTWDSLKSIAGDRMCTNVSFWPMSTTNSPYYLCDSDIITRITSDSIIGYAFVFYHEDSEARIVEGMMHTYIVSSFFTSATFTITHARTFLPFPSMIAQNRILSCIPSIVFRQMLGVKEQILLLLNTRSMTSRCIVSTRINNINPYTWYYIISNTPLNVLHHNVVQKNTYIYKDEFFVEKFRTQQYSLEFTLPAHLMFAQNLFGSGLGLGTRHFLRCSLKQRGLMARMCTTHQISYTDTMNVIPFEINPKEEIRRGLELKYIPSEMELCITVRFRIITGKASLEPEFEARNLSNRVRPQNPEYDNYYPLFSDTEVFGSKIYNICLGNQSVMLVNNRQYSVEDVKNEIDRLL